MGIVQLRDRSIDTNPSLAGSPPRSQRSLVPPRRLTRRRLLRTAGGAIVVGAALAAGARRVGVASAQGLAQAVPIPGGSPAIQEMAGGQLFHVFGPGTTGVGLDPVDAEPSTITDFSGAVGLAYLNGTVTRTNTATGEVRTLPMVGSDMRFMKGMFRSSTGQVRQGAFAFV